MTGVLFRRDRHRTQTQIHMEGRPWRGTERTTVCKPRRGTSEETHPADTLILGLQLPDLPENTLLLFKPLSLQIFVTVAWANSHMGLSHSAPCYCPHSSCNPQVSLEHCADPQLLLRDSSCVLTSPVGQRTQTSTPRGCWVRRPALLQSCGQEVTWCAPKL